MNDSLDTLQAQARAALNDGRLDEADALGVRLIEQAPDDANGPFIRGIVAARQGRSDDARHWLQAARDMTPAERHFMPELWLGHVARSCGDWPDAEQRYRTALTLHPERADVRVDLARSLWQQDRVAAAAAQFVIAGRDDPDRFEALQGVVDCAATQAARGLIPDLATSAPVSDHPNLVSFVVCSITPARLAALAANLGEVMAGHAWELVHIDNAKSLCEGYNRGMMRARGDLLVFCHDDIEILRSDFAHRLLDACRDADVVGVVGTTLLTGPTVSWSGTPHLHGRITHVDEESGGLRVSLSSLAPARVDGIQAMDGLFIAAWRTAAERVGFDEATFDGFHFYDMDFSYRAWLLGLRTRVQSDLGLSHRSRGQTDEAYWRYARLFLGKFPDLPAAPFPNRPALFEALLYDRQQAIDFLRWLSAWLDSPTAAAANGGR